MSWNAVIKWTMVVTGALTLTMVYAAIAPEAVTRSTFGESVNGDLAEIIVRNWGVLIGLVGAMLIYGAYHPEVRSLVLVVAGLSKLVFIGLILIYGRRYLGAAGLPVAIDLAALAIFAAYLVTGRRRVERPSPAMI